MDRSFRTRRQINFLKEAGLEDEIIGMPQQRVHRQPHKKQKLRFRKKIKKISDNLQFNLDSSKHEGEGKSFPPGEDDLSELEHNQLNLSDIVVKMDSIKISHGTQVEGYYGHATLYFNRPIIEGNYYLQFKVLVARQSDNASKLKYPPSFRVGLCPYNYPKNISLGQNISMGYGSDSGNMVYESKSYPQGQILEQNDVVGVCYEFSPPDRYQSVQKNWINSVMKVVKNGKQILHWDKINQCFYCPAVSLFNYAKIDFRLKRETMEYLPAGYKPYLEIYSEDIAYKNLYKNPIFSQFV